MFDYSVNGSLAEKFSRRASTSRHATRTLSTGQRLPQSYVGLLTDAQGNGKLLVSSLRHGTAMTVKVIGPITPPAQGRLLLWAVPAAGPAFVLGPVPLTGSATSQLPGSSEKLLSKVQKLVVTLESDAAPTAPGGLRPSPSRPWP